MRAAAPPPTALNSDTSCGIAVIFTVRAVYRPAPPPMAMPTRMMIQATALMPSPYSCWARIRTAVAPIASVMPPADTRLPLRAVAGEFIRMSPMTKAPAPISHAMRTMTSMIPRVVTPLCLRLGDGLGRDGLLAEHLEHAVGDHVAADDVHRRERDGQQRQDLAGQILGVGCDQHPAHEH